MRALVLLALLAIQDPDLGTLLKQLEDESIETREKAAATLVELGDKAEERVRKHLESVEGELKARCEAILNSIQSRRKLASLLPPLRPVTLEAKDAKLRDVLESLQKQSGMTMQLDGVADSNVSVAVKDVTPLEALNAVCKAAELGWYVDGQRVKGRLVPPPAFGESPGGGGTSIRFQSGGFIDVPRFFIRHYSVTPTNISINRWSDFRATSSSASLQLRLSWMPETKPDHAWFDVKRVTDDKGRTLYENVKGAMGAKFRAGMMPGGGIFRSQTEAPIPLTFPEADAKSIASVTGTATIRFLVAEKTLLFDSPEGAPATSKDHDGLTVELLECRTVSGQANVKLAIRGRPRGASPDVPYQQVPPVRVKLDDGTTAPGSGTSMSSDGTMTRYELTFHRVTSKIAAIEVVVDTAYHTDSFDFELKDIPLPK